MILDDLLHLPCASIQSRIRREILGEDPASTEMAALQTQILSDEAVRSILQMQQPEGWIAWSFHGYNSMESGIRMLCEKDVDHQHSSISSARDALQHMTNRLERGIRKPGKVLDDSGLGGSQTIRAVLLAQMGDDKNPIVQEQIGFALSAFTSLLQESSIGDFTEDYQGKLVYREGIRWPCIYHLRLLAFTNSWRTPTNLESVTAAVERLVLWSPIPQIYFRCMSQLVAPASFAMHNFASDLSLLDDAEWMIWFHQMELLARLGIVHRIPQLQDQVIYLEEELARGNGWFAKPLAHESFRKWGAYTGLMLENNWKRASRREYDLTFRSQLILHYFKNQVENEPISESGKIEAITRKSIGRTGEKIP